MTIEIEDRVAADVATALGVLPEDFWEIHDDKCDCTYQRIQMWTNPYLAETLEVRVCCIWKELYKLFPQYVRNVPAFKDYNNGDAWVPDSWDWNGEEDMPQAIWYRQLAHRTGKSVAEIREEYRDRDDERPRGVRRPVAEVEEQPDPIEVLWEALTDLATQFMEYREAHP